MAQAEEQIRMDSTEEKVKRPAEMGEYQQRLMHPRPRHRVA